MFHHTCLISLNLMFHLFALNSQNAGLLCISRVKKSADSRAFKSSLQSNIFAFQLVAINQLVYHLVLYGKLVSVSINWSSSIN